MILDAIEAPELAAVCARVAANAAPEDYDCQMELFNAEVRTERWEAARLCLDRLSARAALTPMQRVGVLRARRSLSPR